jgi:hypothetical protein
MLVAVVLALLAVKIFRVFRWLPLTMATRDPARRFSGVDRALIMARAGGRCERHSLLLGRRCRVTEGLHADHIHPYSRGGSTTVGNGQALCARHNKQKAARIPYQWQLRRMEKQRLTYYPAGVSRTVIRRSSRAPRAVSKKQSV